MLPLTDTGWRCHDNRDYREEWDERDEDTIVEVLTSDQLEIFLRSHIRQDDPGVVLCHPSGSCMFLVALSEEWGAVIYFTKHPSRSVIATTITPTFPDPICFRNEGQPLRLQPKSLFPIEEVIRIVRYAFENCRLPDWIQWE